jgi:iron-sulfur cluster repair protein YtfE (RIC family)
MDAIQFLKKEHEKAKGMFRQIEQAQGEARGQLWSKLSPELKAHEKMEEQHLYGPVAREAGGRDAALAQWEKHHREEVAKAEALIRKLDAADPSGQAWMVQLRELKGALEHHIQQEEGEIWPKISQVWDAGRLDQAGQQMEKMAKKVA